MKPHFTDEETKELRGEMAELAYKSRSLFTKSTPSTTSPRLLDE